MSAKPLDETRAPAQSAEEGSATLSPIKRALQEIRQLRAQLAEVEAASATQRHPIAIVGAGMRFPGGVVDAGSFWDLLAAGRDGITEIPRDRWDWRLYFNRNQDAPGAMNSIRGGFLDGVDTFDADFFGLSPREAAMLDPQQRLLHEVAWHALEDAAIRPDLLSLSCTGVFIGLSNTDYYRAVLQDDLRIDAYAGSGTSSSMAAGRLAYTLGVRGPVMTVDTACSSSLAAIHLACQSLRAGECDLALAGGVNVILAPQMHIVGSRAHMLAPDGRCKTFDEAADGYVRSEGCAVVVLKRLKDAVEAGDRVLAVVRGSALNHDGRSAGLTAPSREAQAQLLRDVYSHAGVALDEVGMIEAHGTGTSLGDPIEMEALGEVFAGRPSSLSPIAVGSVKTNLGHAEAASGMVGLLKAALSLRHRQIPPHLNLEKKSAFISWADLPFHIPLERMEWKLEAGQRRRIAGVSSFGFSGSNAHVVLEEFVSGELDAQPDAEQEPQAVVLSGRSKEALTAAQSALAENLRGNDDISLRDVCHTLSRGRMHHVHRRAYVVSTRAELLQKMNSEMGGANTPRTDPVHCFLFTGQGSEHTGMGFELDARSGVVRAAVDRLEGALDGRLGKSIREIWANANREQERPSLVQPALYAYGWALSELWRSWNVQPRVVLGHSLGEYVAATVACVMSPEEGIRLVAARGRLIEGLVEKGAMVSVAVSKLQVDAMLAAASLEGELSIAAINGPASVVVSGRREAIDTFEQKLREASVRHKRLRTTHGFHSAVLDGMLEAFEAEASAVAFRVPEVPWISNLTGTFVHHDSPVDAQYWRQHLRQTVEFSQGLATARALEVSAFLEIGAEPHLSALAEANDIAADACIPSIVKGAATGEWHSLLTAASRLYAEGTELDWEAVDDHRPYRKIALPGYPFQRVRFWFNTAWPKGEEARASMAQAAADQASMVPIRLPAANINPGLNAVNGWAVALMLATLQDLGCFCGTDDCLDTEALIGRYGVPATHRRLMERWLRRLSSEGILMPLEDGENPVYALTSQATFASPESIWAETEQLGDEPLRCYLANCAALLPRVLRGEINPLETLFPGGDDRLAKRLYEESPASVYVNRIAAAAIAARMRQPSQTAMGYPRRLHILEVGAGTGATTSTVLAQLDPERVVYTFSDLSEVFLARARQRFHGHPMEFTLFDLDRADHAAAHQGRYDVVLAANSLHAAKDLRVGLARLFDALQPGGSLVLVETTADHAWHEVSTGLIEGWQHFTDASRSNGSPLLPPERWAEELALVGFENFSAAPSAEQATHPLGLHVLMAHKPSHAHASRASGTIPSTELNGLTLFAASGPVTNELGDGAATKLVEEIAEASPRQRASLAIEAVTTAVAEVLGRIASPAKDERLMELGLDSLMALELRDRLQTAFGIERLSSTLVFDYPTSEAIAKFLLTELDRKLSGREIDLANEQVDVPGEEAAATARLHSEEELDQMSTEEIAELLRKQLE
jgi:acyl transferase domain-containing protein/SAM-dependent methyltransferase/acyl carrier protein